MKSIILMLIMGMALLISSCQEQTQNPLMYPENRDQAEPGAVLLLPGVEDNTLDSANDDGLNDHIPQCILLSEFPDWPTDKFDLKNSAIKDDVMILTLVYYGGCIEHEFRLVVSTTFEDSDPLQISAQVFHTPGNDPCHQRITEVRRFDISPLKEFLFKKYPKANCIEVMINFQSTGSTQPPTAYNVCRKNNEPL